jgi:16S rRNA processing protein RimM
MGRIAAPYGVQGWVKVTPHTQARGTLTEYPRWWLGRNGEWNEVTVVESKVHGASIVAQIEGYSDRDQAAKLRGSEVGVPRNALPAARPNEYYWADLIGLDVVNAEGTALGAVTSLFSNGAHDVMRVGEGKSERLIPFVETVIRKVDLAQRRIEVDWGADW